MPADDGGLLGDLPRARPGTRSPKRDAAPQRKRAEPTPAPPRPGTTAGEVATQPLRLAVGAAEAGLRIASRVTGELIRRLPRP